MKLYEGMFLVEAGRAARDWEGTESEVTSILERYGAEVQSTARYDERKLAYPIQGHRRGAYLLAYFSAETDSIHEMRADFKLSEAVLRNLIVRVASEVVPEAGALGTSDPVREAPPAPPPEESTEEAPATEEAKPEEAKAEKTEAEKPEAEAVEAKEPEAEEAKAEVAEPEAEVAEPEAEAAEAKEPEAAVEETAPEPETEEPAAEETAGVEEIPADSPPAEAAPTDEPAASDDEEKKE